MDDGTRTAVEPSDAQLVAAVRSGDTTAFGVLFQRHSLAATRLARVERLLRMVRVRHVQHERLVQEQTGDGFHGQEQAAWLLLQRQEAEMPVKGFRRFVLGIDQHGHRCNVDCGFKAATQRVQQQQLSNPLALHVLVDGQPTNQRHR